MTDHTTPAIDEGIETIEPAGEATTGAGRVGDFIELTKPRLTAMAVMTTLAGYWVGAEGNVELAGLIHPVIGTLLVGGACGAINMAIERPHDARMRRTANRPIAAGRISVAEGMTFGVVMAIAGLVWLAVFTNALAALLAGATLVSYLLLYTPLKRVTTLNTIVGGIPGALPPVIGWAAARGSLGFGALALFALLFFWQMPHFLALSWMYRKDYARAGYVMLPVLDEEGITTSRQILLYVAALIPVSLIPTLAGISGPVYFVGATVLGATFFWLSLRLARSRRNNDAKWLFHFSNVYLLILFLCMAIDGI